MSIVLFRNIPEPCKVIQRTFLQKGILQMCKNYIRIGVLSIEEVIPFVFTRKVRKALVESGITFTDKLWAIKSSKTFEVIVDGITKKINISMGSHRYQLFAEKGLICKKCGITGKYFAIEKARTTKGDKYHLNLYATTKSGQEMMITKDHIKPRAKGGQNRMDNYQVLCQKCNLKKADKI